MPKNTRNTRTSNDINALSKDAWPEITPAFLKVVTAHGDKMSLNKGEVFFELGQASYDFAYIEKGGINIVDRANDRTVVCIKKGQFVGEIGMLMGQRTFLAGVADTDTELIRISQKKIIELVAIVPEIGDVVVNAFAARRRLLMEWGEGGLVIIGNDKAKSTASLLEFANRSKIPHRYVDKADTVEVAELAKNCSIPDSETVAVIGNSQVICDPTPLKLASEMGLDLVSDTDTIFDVLIVGAGPAGLAASIYAASEGLKVLAI